MKKHSAQLIRTVSAIGPTQEGIQPLNLALELLSIGLSPKGSARRRERIYQDLLLPKRAERRAKKAKVS